MADGFSFTNAGGQWLQEDSSTFFSLLGIFVSRSLTGEMTVVGTHGDLQWRGKPAGLSILAFEIVKIQSSLDQSHSVATQNTGEANLAMTLPASWSSRQRDGGN